MSTNAAAGYLSPGYKIQINPLRFGPQTTPLISKHQITPLPTEGQPMRPFTRIAVVGARHTKTRLVLHANREGQGYRVQTTPLCSLSITPARFPNQITPLVTERAPLASDIGRVISVMGPKRTEVHILNGKKVQ